jgi:hypothetical protein
MRSSSVLSRYSIIPLTVSLFDPGALLVLVVFSVIMTILPSWVILKGYRVSVVVTSCGSCFRLSS